MATGTVQRFDPRRGFGFIKPDVPGPLVDGQEQDVFVHQNDIEMDGFRSLQEGEKVEYDEEIGEKGPKAVHVKLVSERAPRAPRGNNTNRRPAGPRRGPAGNSGGDNAVLKNLIQLLVDTDTITASECQEYGLGNVAQSAR